MNARKLSLALSLPLALAAVAAPASAAPNWNGHDGNNANYIARELRSEIRQLDRQIDRAQATRRISSREAAGLHRDVDGLQRLYANYARGGFTNGELRSLQNRVDQVERNLNKELRDTNRRNDHYRR